MDELDARLKAERIDFQIDETQRPSDTQKFKVYNMFPPSKNYCFAACRNLLFITIDKRYNFSIVEWSNF